MWTCPWNLWQLKQTEWTNNNSSNRCFYLKLFIIGETDPYATDALLFPLGVSNSPIKEKPTNHKNNANNNNRIHPLRLKS